MSAEGKKKRGESGLKNAQSQPFRLGGRGCDYSTSPRPCYSPYGNGSAMIRAYDLGNMLAPKYPVVVSTAAQARVERALDRVEAKGYRY